MKLAIVVSHPIQHFCPQYVSFAAMPEVELKVFFGSALGYKKYVDRNFGREISWGNLHLDKFSHVFLNGDEVLASNSKLDAPNLDEELTKFAPGIVIIYGYYQKLQRRAYRWAVKNKAILGYISDSERRHRTNWMKEMIKFFYVRSVFSKVHFFLSVGNANEEYYRHYGVTTERIVRMHFPIDIILYEQSFQFKASLAKKIREQFAIADGDICMSVVGKLIAKKNQHRIIDAMRILDEEGIHTHLFIIGSGEEKEQYERKAAQLSHSQVHFPGFVTPDELPAYYAASDIYIHPSLMDPHPLAVSEAIYMGCPVIISNTCGSYGESDDVQVGKNGFVYDVGDTKQLALFIKKLISDRKMRNDFADESHRIAAQFQKRSHETSLLALIERAEKIHYENTHSRI